MAQPRVASSREARVTRYGAAGNVSVSVSEEDEEDEERKREGSKRKGRRD